MIFCSLRRAGASRRHKSNRLLNRVRIEDFGSISEKSVPCLTAAELADYDKALELFRAVCGDAAMALAIHRPTRLPMAICPAEMLGRSAESEEVRRHGRLAHAWDDLDGEADLYTEGDESQPAIFPDELPPEAHPARQSGRPLFIRPLADWNHGLPHEIMPLLLMEKGGDIELVHMDGDVCRFFGLTTVVRLFAKYGPVPVDWRAWAGVEV